MSDELFLDVFEEVNDPRVQGKVKHLLKEILFMAVTAIIGGADKWPEVELFCKSKKDWFKKFLVLEYGIPSHDTFERVFAVINPSELRGSFVKWINTLVKVQDGEIIAIDGKTLRQSFIDDKTNKSAIHMVSAWASEAGVVLGQVKVDDKSNEITAIPKLLKILEIEDCIITIDAMGCQKKITDEIIKKDADYVLAVKDNQKNLHKDIESFFNLCFDRDFKGIEYDFHDTFDTDHGRIERRKYWITDDISDKWEDEGWNGIKSFGMTENTITRNGKTTVEVRHFITSLPPDAKKFGRAVRKHWGIENSLHWVLDISFREDESRIRKGHSGENFAVLRHIALNAIKKENSKGSIKSKRLKSGWDEKFLEKILSNIF